jgi:hypothetical protein
MLNFRLAARVSFFGLLSFIFHVTAQGQQPTQFLARALTSVEAVGDVGLLRLALEQVHSGYDRYVPRRTMDSAFARLERRATLPITEVEFYREVALLLANIRCNHTKAEYPQSLNSFRNTQRTHLPMRLRVFGPNLYVAQIFLARRC